MVTAHHEDVVGTAALAKAALRLLAERRLVPTPENYEQAWRRVSGDLRGHDAAPPGAGQGAASSGAAGTVAAVAAAAATPAGTLAAPAAPVPASSAAVPGEDPASSPPIWLVEALIAQLVDLRLVGAEVSQQARRALQAADWMQAGQLLHAELADRTSLHWGSLIGQLQAAFAVPHQGWPAARKREAVIRVIDATGRRDDLLYQRLHGLIESWQREPVVEADRRAGASADAAPLVASPTAVATTGGAADAAAAAASPAGSADPCPTRREARMMAEMTALLSTVCDNLAGMSEQTSWIRGQVDLLRDSLRDPGDYRRLAEVRSTIAQHAEIQHRLQHQRRGSLDEVKQMISTWIESVGDLSRSTGAFGSRIDGYVESISGIESIDELGDTVRAMLHDTQSMAREIRTSHDEMAAVRARAMTLETEVSRLEDELANASTQMIVDHLTQTMNRRGLEQAFAGAQQRAREFRSTLALAVLDVDDFKRVNDTLGHKGGDDALQQLARVFKHKLRATDAVARFGGEEFVLLLPEMDLTQAVAHLTRLQREVTSHVFMSDASRMFITFSAGVTMVTPTDHLTGAVERADQAMYAAKQAGKNCVRAV